MADRFACRLLGGLLALCLGGTAQAQLKNGDAEGLVPASAPAFSKHGLLRNASAQEPAPPPSVVDLPSSAPCVECHDHTVVINLSPGSLLTALESRLNVCGLPPSHGMAGSASAFVDSALIGNRLRLRYDGLWTNTRPDRADFFTARTKAVVGGRGFNQPETNLDMQEFSTHVEMMISQRVSIFAEMPLRAVNPEVNGNRANIGDLNAGFKVAYSVEPDLVQTFQLRVYMPTGSADDGLGVGHPSIEPGLFVWQRLPWNCVLEAELRDWIPINGTVNAGNVLRYGVSLSRDFLLSDGGWNVRPVAELVGWTLLRGQETVSVPLNAEFTQFRTIVDESRSTIINLNLGLRFGTATSDVYLGWSHAMTGPAWFAEGFRLEYRWHF